MANILHIRFPNQYTMCSTFLRFQEAYESTEFKGKNFTHEEFFDWYAETNGRMSYFEDWAGFNFPIRVLTKFFTAPDKNVYRPLWKKELLFLNFLKQRRENLPAYVIGTNVKDTDEETTLRHEVVHSIFATFPDYATTVTKIVDSYKLTAAFTALEKKGYEKSVHIDELNAYSVTGLPRWLEKKTNVDKVKDQLIILFNHKFGVMNKEIMDKLVETVEWENVK